MNGHDISVGFPLESKIAADAAKVLQGRCTVEHTDLESYWDELEKHLDLRRLPVLNGERRSYLKQGMWTYLMPATISARTYLKQQDFAATVKLVHCAEPLASLASSLGAAYPADYLERGWNYLLSNHTHDANGGCAPDSVCLDMEYRYRKASDIGDIVTEDAMQSHCRSHLSPAAAARGRDSAGCVQSAAIHARRDHGTRPRGTAGWRGEVRGSRKPGRQAPPRFSPSPRASPVCSWTTSGTCRTILDTNQLRLHARFSKLPALGYRAYPSSRSTRELRARRQPGDRPRPHGE